MAIPEPIKNFWKKIQGHVYYEAIKYVVLLGVSVMTPYFLQLVQGIQHVPQIGLVNSALLAVLTFCALLLSVIFFRGSNNTPTLSPNSPNFEMEIEQVYHEFSESNNNTVLIFAINLINRGAPSITRGWRGECEINGYKEKMNPIHMTGTWIIRRGNQTLTIRPEDQITTKTFERRVETGEGKVGRIFFTMPGKRYDQLQTLNFRAVITFTDFLGKTCSANFVPHPTPLVGVDIYPGEMGEILATDAVVQLPSKIEVEAEPPKLP
jgi:hypothetical protein